MFIFRDRMNRKKYNKGIIGAGIIAQFIFAVFIVIFVLIFLFQFKYHIIQTMGEYYLWGKEFDIPLALLITDINNQNSAVALNKIYYSDELGIDATDLKNGMQELVTFWFSTPSKNFKYHLQFGNLVITADTLEKCSAGSAGPHGSYYSYCPSKDDDIKKRNVHGFYPIPVMFNGTDRVVPLEFESLIVMESGG